MRKIFQKIDYIALALCVAIPMAMGVIGSFFVESSVGDWYAALTKPAFTPPNWLFAPVWTTLYVLMGVASYLVMKSTAYRQRKEIPALVYGVQLLLNVAWPILFFGLQAPRIALVNIIILLGAIIATAVIFWRYSKPATALLAPYIAWVSFALVLNIAIIILN